MGDIFVFITVLLQIYQFLSLPVWHNFLLRLFGDKQICILKNEFELFGPEEVDMELVTVRLATCLNPCLMAGEGFLCGWFLTIVNSS